MSSVCHRNLNWGCANKAKAPSLLKVASMAVEAAGSEPPSCETQCFAISVNFCSMPTLRD